jgi:hypothetical protein
VTAAPPPSLARPAREVLAARLALLGLRDVTDLRTHHNQATLVSLTARGVLRLHADYAEAPDRVLLAIVRFLRRGATRAERSASLAVLRSWPVSSPVRPPRTRGSGVETPRDARLLERLGTCWRELNARHFGDALLPIPIRLCGRMRRRLGHVVLDRQDGRASEIAISRRFARREAWVRVEETLLHEMVHQWQAETGRRVDHGREFRAKAREVGIRPRAVEEVRGER